MRATRISSVRPLDTFHAALCACDRPFAIHQLRYIGSDLGRSLDKGCLFRMRIALHTGAARRSVLGQGNPLRQRCQNAVVRNDVSQVKFNAEIRPPAAVGQRLRKSTPQRLGRASLGRSVGLTAFREKAAARGKGPFLPANVATWLINRKAGENFEVRNICLLKQDSNSQPLG
jgi:hypothetical protein